MLTQDFPGDGDASGSRRRVGAAAQNSRQGIFQGIGRGGGHVPRSQLFGGSRGSQGIVNFQHDVPGHGQVLEQVELQQGRILDQVPGLGRVLDAGQLDDNPAAAGLLDGGFRHTKLVHPVADDLQGPAYGIIRLRAQGCDDVRHLGAVIGIVADQSQVGPLALPCENGEEIGVGGQNLFGRPRQDLFKGGVLVLCQGADEGGDVHLQHQVNAPLQVQPQVDDPVLQVRQGTFGAAGVLFLVAQSTVLDCGPDSPDHPE
ncbi:hypothetical protein ES703_90494 [subsurface metagenome]